MLSIVVDQVPVEHKQAAWIRIQWFPIRCITWSNAAFTKASEFSPIFLLRQGQRLKDRQFPKKVGVIMMTGDIGNDGSTQACHPSLMMSVSEDHVDCE
jgi:hypothetical protein